MKKMALSMLFVMLCFCAIAQHKMRLFGYVTDMDHRPIELATVFLQGTSVATSTSSKGFFELTFFANDTIKLVVFCVGYQSVIKKIPIGMSAAQLNVMLFSSIHQLKDVEVRAQRIQTTTIEPLNAKQMRLLPDASGGNIESLLSTLPGVHSNNELSSQYSVRGGSYDENSVYVNGIEVYRPLLIRAGQQEGLSFINPDMVDQVDFSAGGFAPKYGDKMSSALSITYKRPTAFEGSVSTSLLGATAYVGSSNKKITQLQGIRYKTNAYLLGTLPTKGHYNPSFFDYQTYETYQLSPKATVSFLGNLSQNKYQFFPQEEQTSFGTLQMPLQLHAYFDGQEKDLFTTSFGAFTFSYKPIRNLTMNLVTSAFNTNESETYDIVGQYWLSQLAADGSGKATPESTLGVGTYQQHARDYLNATVANVSHTGSYTFDHHFLEWSLGVQREAVSNQMKEWEYRDSAGYSLPYNPSSILLYSNLDADLSLYSTRFLGYLQDTYKYRNQDGLWIFTGGFRSNYWTFNREWLVSPRLTIAFAPQSSNFVFRFATGVYYQAPFFKDVRDTVTVNGNTVAQLNSHIKAQRSLHFVLGGDYHFVQWDRPFKFSAECYYKPADRVIPYVVDNVNITYFGGNSAKAYAAGLDMKLFGEFVPGTDSWISLSLMQSQEKLLKGVDSNGNPIYTNYIARPNDQRYSVSMFFQDFVPSYPRIKVNLKLIWADGLPVSPPNNPYVAPFRTPPYQRVDIGAAFALINKDHRPNSEIWRFVKAAWINVDVFNLLDIYNVNSFFWVTDIYNRQYPVPNYLTGRLLNVKFSVDF
jgi:hypothetical protein